MSNSVEWLRVFEFTSRIDTEFIVSIRRFRIPFKETKLVTLGFKKRAINSSWVYATKDEIDFVLEATSDLKYAESYQTECRIKMLTIWNNILRREERKRMTGRS